MKPKPDPSCTARFKLTAAETALVLDALSVAMAQCQDINRTHYQGNGADDHARNVWRRGESFRDLLVRLVREVGDREPCGDPSCVCARDRE